MLDKIKKVGIIVIIAVLFTLFVFSIVDVIIESPEYEDFCPEKLEPVRPAVEGLECPAFEGPSDAVEEDCFQRGGVMEYDYDEKGCPVSFECNTCRQQWEDANEQYRLVVFIITSIIGVIALIAGMYVTSRNEVVEWVMAGILIGGIASIFFGTSMYFRDMGRFVKPIILLVEMALIIWVAVKTLSKKK